MSQVNNKWPLTSIATAFLAGALLMAQAVSGQDTFVPADNSVLILKGDEASVDATVSFVANEWDVSGDATFLPAFAMSDDSMYLDWPNIQKELEMAEDQIQQIQKAREASFKAMGEYMKQQQGPGKQLSQEKMQEFMKENQAKAKDAIDEILLPHQQRRLKQVALQMRMQHQGVSGALMSKEVAEALGISEKQLAEMKKSARESQIEMQKEMERLRMQSREKVLANLTETQRKKLKEMTGDDMKNRSPAFGAVSVSTDKPDKKSDDEK